MKSLPPALSHTLRARVPALIATVAMVLASGVSAAENAPTTALRIESSHAKLAAAFRWATTKALSYVQTGKTGPLDGHENQRAGAGAGTYIPSYWAGYPWRTAFYSRDYCHQAAGAHLLGLQRENLAMLRAFAASATEARKGYPLWALNFDGSPFRLDYRNDDDFVREVPAVFELVEQCHRQFLWTGDRTYLVDPVLSRFCAQATTEFIAWHDARMPNGVAEGEGSGDIFRGTATYNEIRTPLLEAGDGIACQYQALRAQSRRLHARGETVPAARVEAQADALRALFHGKWGVTPDSPLYVRGYDPERRPRTDFGLENSWFMPMKFITEPSPRTDAFLDFIARSVDDPAQRPRNLEAVSYLPGVFFPYHRVDTAWKWLEYLIDAPDREYPEISFTILSHTVEGLLGFDPDAPQRTFATVPRLPASIADLTVREIPLGEHRLDVGHAGAFRSVVTHRSGRQPLTWIARFPGEHASIHVDGQPHRAESLRVHGVPMRGVRVELPPGRTVTAEIR